MSDTSVTEDARTAAAIQDLGNFLCSITNPAYFDWYKVRDMGATYGVVVHVKIGNNKYLYRIGTSDLIESHAQPERWRGLMAKLDEWVGTLVQTRMNAENHPPLFTEAIGEDELSSLNFRF